MVAPPMIDSRPKRLNGSQLPLTGSRRALGEQLDRLEQLGVPLACPRVELDESERQQLRRRLRILREDPPNRPDSGS